MRRFLEILTIFDWTVLPRALVGDVVHGDGGGTFTFHTPINGPWCAADIQAMLQSKGISMWGTAYFGGEMSFRVKRSQAAWAQYILLQNGVPLLHGLLKEKPTSPRHAGGKSGGRGEPDPATGAGPQSPARHAGWLDGLASLLFDD